jgi:16S rRNA (guanine527-N7)-methyltransferase
MDTSQIAQLLEPFVGTPLSATQLDQVSTYVQLLLRWNEKMNLTAIRDEKSIVTRHFGESFFAAQALIAGGADGLRIVDVGSGAGFPGLPMKLWAPTVELTLVESVQKKATFLREVIRTLGLRSATVFGDRAERFPSGSADLVTLRAVELFGAVLPVASRMVAPGGRLALLIGADESGQVPVLETGFQWQDARAIPLSAARWLRVGVKRAR